MFEALLAIWPILIPFIMAGVWALRLEGLVKMTISNMLHLQDRVDRQESDIKAQLAKIDGRLESIVTSLERVIWRIPRDHPGDE